MKTKLFALSILLLSAFAITSCDVLDKGIKLTDQSKIDKKLSARINKYIPEDVTVYQIEFSFTEKLEEYATFVNVVYTDAEGNLARKQIGLEYDTKSDIRIPWSLEGRTPETGVKLSEIDFSKIASNIGKGRETMKEADLPFSGIEEYSIEVYYDDENGPVVYHSFELASRVSSERDGTGTTIYYNTYEFAADTDGDVVYIGEEDEDDE